MLQLEAHKLQALHATDAILQDKAMREKVRMFVCACHLCEGGTHVGFDHLLAWVGESTECPTLQLCTLHMICSNV